VHRFILQCCAALVAAILAYLCLVTLRLAQEADTSNVTLQPDPAPDVMNVMPFYRDWTQHPEAETRLTREATIERLHAAVKYVFVIRGFANNAKQVPYNHERTPAAEAKAIAAFTAPAAAQR